MPVNPLGGKKPVVRDPQNVNLFDDKATKLKKRKAELEAKAKRANAPGNDRLDLNQLTKRERAELEEINKQIRNQEFFSKKIF
ncbi:hypothetical protein J6R97_05470 [bacterium]|nr:hypothetical protein [bacterium]